MTDSLGATMRDQIASFELARRGGGLTLTSAARYGRVLDSFARYAAAHGVQQLSEVTPEVCRQFAHAPMPGRGVPSASTSRFRLTAVRSTMRHLTQLGLVVGDPTAGVRVAGGDGAYVPCPLSPLEAVRLLNAGRLRADDRLRPAVVAVALAGGSHREIADLVVTDVDVADRWLHLAARSCDARTVAFDERMLQAITERIGSLRRARAREGLAWDPQVVPLCMVRPVAGYRADSVAPTVSMNLSRALLRAGITRTGVRPRSVREYAANRVYARTQRVEDVAALLGLASLDAAARVVDQGWQERWGEVIRSETCR